MPDPKPTMNERMIAEAGSLEIDNSNRQGEPFDFSPPEEEADDEAA